ncbi:MAG: hypothetical protein KAV87_51675, partial [Desulfobacteraceae bacterium]|nr:hypothetical protein [Desulfobacteraceae bacterium]
CAITSTWPVSSSGPGSIISVRRGAGQVECLGVACSIWPCLRNPLAGGGKACGAMSRWFTSV